MDGERSTLPLSSIFENNLHDGWKAVLGLFLQTVLYLGTIKSIGVYFSELQESLGTTSSDVGLILGLYSGFIYIPAPFITYIHRSCNHRTSLLVTGAVLSSLGLSLGSQMSSNGQLALCLSFAGLGGCILSVCCVITLEQESGQNFQLLYGFGKSGYSIGMVLVPFIAESLMNTYGWRGSMMVIGAIAGNIIPLTMRIGVKENPRTEPNTINKQSRFLADDENTEEPLENSESIEHLDFRRSENDDNGNCDGTSLENQAKPVEDETVKEFCDSLANVTPSKSVTINNDKDEHSLKDLLSNIHQQAKDITSQVDPWFFVFIIASTFSGMVSGGWHAFLIPRTVSSGIPLSTAIYLLYPASVGCFFGRVLSGVVQKHKRLVTLDVYLLVNILNTFALLLDSMVPMFTLKFVTTFLNAFCIAETNILILFLCKDRTSPSFFPLAYASMMVSNGSGNFIGTYLTGLTADLTGNYYASCLLLIAFDAVIICLTIPPRYFPSKYREIHELARG